jgi:hypothetical protein
MTTAAPRPPTGATQAHAFHDGVAFAERFFMGESEVQKALQKCARRSTPTASPMPWQAPWPSTRTATGA